MSDIAPRRRRRPTLVVLVAAVLAATLGGAVRPAAGGGSSDRARRLLQDSEDRHRSRSQVYRGRLEVRTREGKVRKKAWHSYRLGYAGDARLLIRFVDPPEVRGVGYLSLGRPGKDPSQWLYLPSMRRERRIAGRDRRASFVGTDFNFEDLEDFDHSKYEVELEGDDVIEGLPVWLIEVRPRFDSVYGRKRLAMRKDNLFAVRVESFRVGEGSPWKRLTLADLAEVDGHWVARRMEMADLDKGQTTTVWLDAIAFDRDQPEDRFTLHNLDREDDD